MKNILLIVASLSVILTLGLLEQGWITDTFNELETKTQQMIDECEDHTLTYESMQKTLDWWQEQKSTVHIYLRHDAIANLDYWLSEAQGHIKYGDYNLAAAQLAIALDASKTIPISFRFRMENIF